MKRLVRGLALALLVAAGCATARARSPQGKWLEIRSPHFVVFTNGRYSRARDVAQDFEQIREVFLKLAPGIHADPAEPVRILAVRNGRDMKRLLPAYWAHRGQAHPEALFVRWRDRSYVALRMDVAKTGDYHLAYDGYVLLLESLNFKRLPLWTSEGLASFYAAARIEGKYVGLGYPIPGYLTLLQQYKWIPLVKLLTADQSSPIYTKSNPSTVFYAESWELTHYLLTSKKGSLQPELLQYIELYEKGVPSLKAARQTFGNLHKLERSLDEYYRQYSYNYLRVKTSIARGKAKYPSHVISTARKDAVIGDFYARTSRPQEARETLDQAIQLNPKLPGPYESLGMLAMQERNEASAMKWLSQAAARGSKDYLVYYYRATLLLRQEGMKGEAQATDEVNRSLALNPRFAEGFRFLAQLYAMQDEKLGIAAAVVRRAIELKPGAAANYLTLGTVLLRQQKFAKAQAAGQKALSLAKSGSEREQAQDFLHQVEQMRSAAAAARQMPAPVNVPVPGARPSSAGSPQTAAPAGKFPKWLKALIVSGPVRGLRCNGNELSFLLMVNGMGVPLVAPDAKDVRYVGFPAKAEAGSPCLFLKGRQVTVHFRPAHGKPYAGTILEVDAQH